MLEKNCIMGNAKKKKWWQSYQENHVKKKKKNEWSAKDHRMKRFKEKRRHVLVKEFGDNERIFKSKMTR